MGLVKNMQHIKNIKFAKKVGGSSNSLIKGLYKETSKGLTQNGAVTYTRSGSELLDFYAQAGAMRNSPDQALNLFKKAYSEDKLIAIKILFYLRDVRGGQGERELFRKCLEWLGNEEPKIFSKIVKFVPEYGRFDDLFFDNETCFEFIKEQLDKDSKSVHPSLLAKWLPTINASSLNTRQKAKFIANKLEIPEIIYRKTLRNIRKVIETVESQMSAQEWSDINYSKVPSQASRIYKNCFLKHDEKRYSKFIEKAEKGEVKINASTLYPYQIYDSVNSGYSRTLEALWNQLPDYTRGNNALVVADTSGSMMGRPMSVSVSLALYFAERNKGQFKDYFISFSEQPKLHKIKGEDLRAKMRSIQLGDVANTNIQAVFDLILNTAVNNNTPEDEMPSTIYIISDMEFDSAQGYTRNKTNYEAIEKKYKQAGYKKPNLVFWNVNASGSNLPVQMNEDNVALVSGFSPVIFKMVTEGKTPEEVMMDTINSERYAPITIK